ncbi:ABC transporter permease [Micromonospora sp. NBC_01796]|uniref:ABC transporter permease n=1 Tax=Micromonospora sp. NBC_01796 TaxID=2975987 RepID=UPI002DDC51A0|nr:ABC transporter permease [Micromonospora sp. NBC_01796]WSA84735.1 ABC transporter permease [Micromonospora sp. NBC_01796]
MTTLSYAAHDSATMLRRNLKRMVRYPSLTMFVIGGPLVFLLLFVFVFGGTLGAGLGGTSGGRAEYLRYVVPGILMMTVAGTAQGTAISIAMDMTEGIVARFRTMAISRAAVLTGHVVGAMLQTLLAIVVVIGVALLLGFRPSAGPVEWVAAFGVLTMITLAVTWLAVGLGMAAKSVESASNSPSILLLLPFFGSGFVPTDSLPVGLRWFAEYQPFTAVIETLRGLLTGGPIGNNAIIAAAWCLAITVLGYLWALRSYNRDPAR